MSTAIATCATIDDLLRVEGKAELIGGRIVALMGTGSRPGRIGGRIFHHIDDWAETTGVGIACTGTVIFAVAELPSGRESFSPDAAYYDGPMSADDMKPVPGPPTLAVEVRGDGDYGPAAERKMAEKRADYFAAGTRVVWDADPHAELILVYRPDAPDIPTTYGRGQVAEAEPAVPGWRPLVDDLFPAR